MSNLKIATAMLLFTSIFASVSLAQSVEPQPRPRVAAIKAEIQEMTRQHATLNEKLAISKNELEKLSLKRSKSLEKQDTIGVSAESFPEIMKTLQSQRIQLTVDLAGLEARRNMLAEAREENSKEVDNELLRPLLEILEIEKVKLEDVKKLAANGSVSNSELLNAKRRILTVEVQIAEAKSRQANTTYTSRVNSNLLDTALEHADKQARLETTQILLEKLTESRTLVEDSTSHEQQISILRALMAETISDIQQVEARIDQLQMNLEQIQ